LFILEDYPYLLFQYRQFVPGNIPNNFPAECKILMDENISQSHNSLPVYLGISFSNINRNIFDGLSYYFKISHHRIDRLFIIRKCL